MLTSNFSVEQNSGGFRLDINNCFWTCDSASEADDRPRDVPRVNSHTSIYRYRF